MVNEGLGIIWEMGLVASLLIVCICLIRQPLKHLLGPTVAYMCWAIVPLTLLAFLLVSLATIFKTTDPSNIDFVNSQNSDAPLVEATHSVIPIGPIQAVFQMAQSETLGNTLNIAWLIGCFLSISTFGLRQWSLHQSLGELTPLENGCYLSQTSVIGPALIGVFKPKIVVPIDFERRFDDSEKAMIIAHEQAHRVSADMLVNAVTTLFQCIYWFNPIVHIAVHLLRLDQEISCDAKVVKQFPKQKKQYAQLLLEAELSQRDLPLNAFWLATSESALKQRVKMLCASNQASPSAKAICITVLIVMCSLGIGLASGLRNNPVALPVFSQLPRIATVQEQALLTAVQEDDISYTITLLKSGVDPNVSIPPLGTPLIVASRAGNLDMVKVLVSGGSRINVGSRGQSFPLFASIENEHAQVAAYLLSEGAQPNALVLEQDASPLSIASQNGSLNMVKLLLDHGADPNLDVDDEGTPLIAAATSGQLNVVEVLIQAGADVKRSAAVERHTPTTRHAGHTNTTALAEAHRFNRADVISFLERENDRQALPDS